MAGDYARTFLQRTTRVPQLHIALTLRNSLRQTQSLGQQTLDTSKMVDQSAWLVVIDQIEVRM